MDDRNGFGLYLALLTVGIAFAFVGSIFLLMLMDFVPTFEESATHEINKAQQCYPHTDGTAEAIKECNKLQSN